MELIEYLTGAGFSFSTEKKIQCECGSNYFTEIHDVSMPNSTARWIECITCHKKYDVRVNLITQEYLDDSR
jgi:hypothetical protein